LAGSVVVVDSTTVVVGAKVVVVVSSTVVVGATVVGAGTVVSGALGRRFHHCTGPMKASCPASAGEASVSVGDVSCVISGGWAAARAVSASASAASFSACV
jgi:adenosyl cobinamide kinase/adenosyl cobinamide phosphate guanylyltransferase